MSSVLVSCKLGRDSKTVNVTTAIMCFGNFDPTRYYNVANKQKTKTNTQSRTKEIMLFLYTKYASRHLDRKQVVRMYTSQLEKS